MVKEIHPNAYDPGTRDGEGICRRFDADGNATHICYPDGGVERRWYDAAGNLLKVCLPEQYDPETDSGEGYAYEYDIMGNLTQVTAPDGSVEARYVYDRHGNLVKAIRGEAMNTGENDGERTGELYAYNLAGWLTESRKPMEEKDGRVRYQLLRYQYDKAGNLVKERRFCGYQTKKSADGAVHTISYAYDTEDRLVRVWDSTGAVVEYEYDAMGRRCCEKQKINDTESRVLRRRYDAGGRMTELVRTADKEGCGRRSVSVRFAYDKNGNIIRTLLPGGGEILREYDAADRLVLERHVEKRSGIDNTTRFAYDKAGNLACITDNGGSKTRIRYDLMNREILRREKDGGATRQIFDRNGQLIRSIRPKEYARAGEEGAGEQYTYDAKGNVRSVIGADGVLKEQRIYDRENRLIASLDGAGSGVEYAYDFGGRRTRVQTKGRASQQYEYDPLGNVTAITDGEGNRTGYVPDPWGRMVELAAADGSRESYAYDCAGNLTRSTDGEGNTTLYRYNAAGQMAVLTDPMGGQEHYAYDEEGRLCKKTDRNGTVTTYAYNLYGNLLERRAKQEGEEAWLSERYEYTPEGLLSAAISGGMRYRYQYDAMGRLSQKSASGRRLVSLSYDLNGNLTEQTDVTGKTTEYRYDVNDGIRRYGMREA